MKMRKYLMLIAVLFIVGCEKDITIEPPIKNEEMPILNDQATFEKIDTKKVGEMCGGIANIKCKAGLECKLTAGHPDSGGTCVESVLQKDLNCSSEKDPVCAEKNGAKNGYLNECEAIRHGAKVISKGFCKEDKTVAGNCEATIKAIGNCKKLIKGFIFDTETNTCVEKTVGGCSAEVPFATIDDCNSRCVK
jgi:hypothetical protein